MRVRALMAGAVLIWLCPLTAQGQERSNSADFASRSAVDVAYCMSSAYNLGLAVAARALGGNKEKFDRALNTYEGDALQSFADALDDAVEADAARQENELAEAQDQFFSLLTAAREWDGQAATAPGLIEASRRLGQQLEGICTELSFSNDEQLAVAR